MKEKSISLTESLTEKRMESLKKAREEYGFENVWCTEGKIKLGYNWFAFWFYFVLGFFMGKCNFLFVSDHAILIFNIISTFYFSLFKTQYFS